MPEPGKTGTFPSRASPSRRPLPAKVIIFVNWRAGRRPVFPGEILFRPHGVKQNREGRDTADVWTERRKKGAEKEAFTKVRTEISKVRIEKTKVLTVFSKVLSVFLSGRCRRVSGFRG